MEDLNKFEKLTTKRLLAYYRSSRDKRKIAPYSWYHFSDEELAEWDKHLLDVKAMLDKREHIEKKDENTNIRKKRI